MPHLPRLNRLLALQIGHKLPHLRKRHALRNHNPPPKPLQRGNNIRHILTRRPMNPPHRRGRGKQGERKHCGRESGGNTGEGGGGTGRADGN